MRNLNNSVIAATAGGLAIVLVIVGILSRMRRYSSSRGNVLKDIRVRSKKRG